MGKRRQRPPRQVVATMPQASLHLTGSHQEDRILFPSSRVDSHSSSQSTLAHKNTRDCDEDDEPEVSLSSEVDSHAQPRLNSKKRKPSAGSRSVSSKKMKFDKGVDVDGRFQCSASWQLSAEIWQYTLTFLTPKMLCRLLSVNKYFNSLLTRKPKYAHQVGLSRVPGAPPLLKPEVIWQLSRQRFWPTMPKPLINHTELQMWQLASQTKCQLYTTKNSPRPSADTSSHAKCEENESQIIWSFSLRSCGPCLLKKATKEIDLLLSSSIPACLIPALPFTFISEDMRVVSSAMLRAGHTVKLPVTKVFLSNQIEAIQKEFVKFKSMGGVKAAQWLKGLEKRGKRRRADALRWERFEMDGGLGEVQRLVTPSYQAAAELASPFDDLALDLPIHQLNQRQETHCHQPDTPKQKSQVSGPSKQQLDEAWDEAQGPLRARISACADHFIYESWRNGGGINKENSPQFAAEVLLHVIEQFYADIDKDDAVARATGRQPVSDDPKGPYTRKLTLDNIKWLFDVKVRPFTDPHRKELFYCHGCEADTKMYGIEAVIQHYAAKHTRSLSFGNVVVHWRAEWPEVPPFHPDPRQCKKQRAVPPRKKLKEAAVKTLQTTHVQPVHLIEAESYYEQPAQVQSIHIIEAKSYYEQSASQYQYDRALAQLPHGQQPSDVTPSYEPIYASRPQVSESPTCPPWNETAYQEPPESLYAAMNPIEYVAPPQYTHAGNGYLGYQEPPGFMHTTVDHDNYPEPPGYIQAAGNHLDYQGPPEYIHGTSGYIDGRELPELMHASRNHIHYGDCSVSQPQLYHNFQTSSTDIAPQEDIASQIKPRRSPASPPFEISLENDMAPMVAELWYSINPVKDLPGPLRIFVVIYHMLTRFRERWQKAPSLPMFLRGLRSNKRMRPLGKVKDLRCKVCGAASAAKQGNRSYTLLQLFNHFRGVHNKQTHDVDGQVLDWYMEMIHLPDLSILSNLVVLNDKHNWRFDLIYSAFSGPEFGNLRHALSRIPMSTPLHHDQGNPNQSKASSGARPSLTRKQRRQQRIKSRALQDDKDEEFLKIREGVLSKYMSNTTKTSCISSKSEDVEAADKAAQKATESRQVRIKVETDEDDGFDLLAGLESQLDQQAKPS
ncbi:hypothetical protein F4808DRAFT_411723 [Astrocystis sublimbata]|nr:hypothetical protein F4808DRAFT_411723 [Astrocystis sublimbata]